jgi:electron transfer flavoprotein alpha subunit
MSRDVAVVVEHLEGRIPDIVFELLGRGRELARVSGGRLEAYLVGQGVAPLAAALGAADAVVLSEAEALAHYTPEAHVRVLAELCRTRQPRVTLIPSSTMGLDVAAGLSGRLDWPLCAYATDVRLEDGRLVVTSQIYAGKLLAEAEVEAPHALVSVLAGASPEAAGRVGGSPAVETVPPPPLGELRTRFRRLIRPEPGDVDITRQPVLVSVGRGIQSRDNLPLVEELAAALGAALSASRPIVDQGWLPKTRQVGKSGMSVRPKLYVAVGISGAPEHLEGMRGAELVVAINSDPGAPIFGVAHYGVVGDLFEILPVLTERIRAAGGA